MNKLKKYVITGFTTVLLLTGMASGAEAASHTVSKGDTLYGLAKKYNTSVSAIKTENNLKSDVIKIGQKLNINEKKTSTTTAKTTTATVQKSETITKTTKSATVASKIDNIISVGKQNLGKPYKYGATRMQNANFDCSSFTQYIFAKNGISIPSTSYTQSKVGTTISRGNLQAGDLVFFTTNGYGTVSHVAVYIGNGQLLHAIKGGVKISSLNENYWSKRYLWSKRVA